MASTWQGLKAQWILIARSTDASLVAIYLLLQVRSRVSSNYFETLMVNKCCILGEKLLGFSLLWLNIDLIREMTIGHPPQREEKDPRTLYLPYNPKPNGPKIQGFLLHFISLKLRFFKPSTSLFL